MQLTGSSPTALLCRELCAYPALLDLPNDTLIPDILRLGWTMAQAWAALQQARAASMLTTEPQ